MRKVLAGFPGVNFALKPFLTERVEESLSGYTASVIVNIYGNDLDQLDERGAQRRARVGRDLAAQPRFSLNRRRACRS